MTRQSWYTLVTAGWLVLHAVGIGKAQEAFFDEGNQRYQQGDFHGALERYVRVLDEGLESGELYYNLGNTYFKIGQLGPAMLYYERARRLMPGDDDLRANIELARSMTADDITIRPTFWLFRVVDWWVSWLPRVVLVWLVALAYLVAMGAIVAVLFRPEHFATWGRRVAGIAGAVTVVFGINLGVREFSLGRAEEAIVMVEEVHVQSAPSDDAALQIFSIHEGTKVQIDRRTDTWIEISLEDGTVGWILAENLEPI